MALVLADRVQETSTTAGTGALTLAGAVGGFQSFAVVGNGNTCYYTVVDGTAWEVGIGTYSTTGPTLARTTVLSNSSGTTSPLSLSSAAKPVFLTYPSEKSVNLDASGNVSPLGTIASGTWQGSTVGVAYGGTGVTTSSGANSVMLRDANQNVSINRLNQSSTTITAAGGTTTLTAASTFSQILVGTGSQTFQLPDATTLTNTTTFEFNNNATGNLLITDYATGAVGTISPGGAAAIALLANGTVGGTWDVHAYIPENVTWGTNSLALGSTVITGGTWNGGTIAPAYGGTGLTSYTSGGAVYATGTSTLTSGTLPIASGGTGATTASGARTSLDVPSTTGLGASGTWGINISGNAASATSAPNYLPLAGGTMTGTLTGVSGTTLSFDGGSTTSASYNYVLAASNDTGTKLVVFVNGSARSADGGVDATTIRNDGGAINLGSTSYATNLLGSSINANGNVVLNAGNYNSYAPTLTGTGASGTWGINISGNAATSTSTTTAQYVINNVDGSVIVESNTSEANNWLWKEAVKQWGIFYFNTGSQSGQTIGTYTTVGAETFYMGGSSGIAMPTGWTGYQSGSYIAAMISHYTGYIYSASSMYAAGSMYSPIYYDSNNTGYYGDFASTSVFSALNFPSGSQSINTTTPGTATYQLNFVGQSTADYAQAITWGWGGSGAQAGIYVQSSGAYGTKMYLATTDSFATGAKTAISIDHSGIVTTTRNFLQATGSLRAPIFYDSDDTTYYLNPNGTSNLNNLTLGNYITTQAYPGILILGNPSYDYLFTNGSWTSSITAGLLANCNDNWEMAIHDSGTRVVSPLAFYGAGANYFLMGRDIGWGTTYVQAAQSFRAPIFYDSDDTNYYVDPGYYSRLVFASVNVGNEAPGAANSSSDGLVLRGNYNSNTWAHKFHKYDNGSGVPLYLSTTYGAGSWTAVQGWSSGLPYTSQIFGSLGLSAGLYAPIFYDSNNTGYYCDPNAYSYLNAVNVDGAVTTGSGGGLRNVLPGGGAYSTGSSTISGAIVIQLPTTNYPMVRFTVKVYTYDGLSFEIACGGHTSSGIWYNTFAYMMTQNRPALNVRFCYGGGNTFVYIGELGSSWSYPQVFITDVQVGYSTYSLSQWNAGWSISFNSSSYQNVSSTHTVYPPPSSSNNTNPIYASIFYDSNNTNYYCDPNSNSQFNSVFADGWFRPQGDTGLYFQTYGYGLYAPQSGGNSYGNVTTYAVGRNGWTGYGLGSRITLMTDTNNGGVTTGLHDSNTSWMWRYVYDSYFSVDRGYSTFANSARAPIFYDSDDTGYYLDPNSTSNSALRIRGGALHGPNVTWGKYLYVGTDGRVGTTATVAVTNGNLHMDCEDGYAMYLNWYSNNNIYTHGYMGIGDSSASYRLHVTGTGYATSDFRAPIFYDSDNTSYYCNPQYISQFYGLAIRGDANSTDTANQIFLWDSGNTTTSSIGFKASGGAFPNPTGFGDGYNTYLGMDTDGRGWVFRRAVGGGNFSAAYTSGWILNNGVWQANASMRAPIFYDSDDTGYYCNPNGNSVFNSANVYGNWYFSGTTSYMYGNGSVNGSSGIGLNVYSTGGNGAIMAFHRGGYYAVNMGLDSDNVIRIGGWSAAANRLQMDMSGNLTMAGNVTAYSDERLKKDWLPLASDFIAGLAGIKSGTYTRIDSGERQVGVSAQDIQKLVAEAVTEDAAGMLSVNYGGAALAAAVELAKYVVLLEKRIAQLEAAR